ncbi:MAG: glycoside hydrolase family 16 [Paludibacteraceae bacterium]|nr:glycoside hydrolase family 16 [Paludibacteraceae bacterium]
MKKILLACVCSIGLFSITQAAETELFGPNVHLYTPSDDPAAIANEIKDIASRMRPGQFSDERHAILFMPGDYTAVGTIEVGYYTHLAGLGQHPNDVLLDNISTPTAFAPSKNVLCNFWRTAENFRVNKSDRLPLEWAVSQAAPIRRVISERRVMYDMGGMASGGFTADCIFLEAAGSKTQQQWYTRNSHIEKGSDGINPGGWNYAYQGVTFGPRANLKNNSDNWSVSRKNMGWGNVSREELTPVIREKPYLFVNGKGEFKVFKPALRRDCKGPSYTQSTNSEGIVLDLVQDFFIAKPGVSAQALNKALEQGKHLFFTPGLYELEEPLVITNSSTIVMGIGLATLIPAKGNIEAAITVEDDVDDVTICSLMFDARYDSKWLLRTGSAERGPRLACPADPMLLADLFFRVGGVVETPTNVEIMAEINTNRAICDHFWLWRADHGKGVGWTQNTCRNGLVVNGNGVTTYGLCNEHTQEYQTVWNGEWGHCFFYQSETPYDMQRQSDYMSHGGTVFGYASYKVGDHVKEHYASMMGIYDVFTKTGGAKIVAENSIEVPDREGVHIHHACNFGISRFGGGFNYLINGQVPSTQFKKGRYYIIDYGKDLPDDE